MTSDEAMRDEIRRLRERLEALEVASGRPPGWDAAQVGSKIVLRHHELGLRIEASSLTAEPPRLEEAYKVAREVEAKYRERTSKEQRT